MDGTLGSVLLPVTVFSLTFNLITALYWAFTFLFLRPSRQDVRNLHISLENYSLPMGSFPSELLHPWAPKELSHESNHTTLPLSVTPEPESGKSELHCQPPTSKPTHDDGKLKPLAVPSPTVSTLLSGGLISPKMPRSAFPIPNVDKLELNSKLPTSAQAAINRVSSPEASFASTLSSEAAGDLALPAMSRSTRRQTSDVKLNAADVHPFTNPTASPILDPCSDQASSDSSLLQQSPKEDSPNAGSAVEVSLPEQTVAEIDTLDRKSDTMSEEVQNDQKQEEEEKSTAAAEDASMESKAPEQQDGNGTTTVEEVPTESQVFEVAIRGLVDLEGSSGSSLEDLVKLVAVGLKARREAEEELKSQTIRYSREIEDVRHSWIDQRGYIENVINGQNDFVCKKGMENNRLFGENLRLDRQNLELKKQLKDQKAEHKRDVEMLEAEKQYAENAEITALAEVEGRISRERQRHEKERIDAINQHTQEMNSQMCLRQMDLDDLATTRLRLNAAENQHKDTTRENYRTIRRLEAEIRRMEPAVAAAVERETSTKDRLEKELKDQGKDKDSKINGLKTLLHESSKETRWLKKDLITLEGTAERRQLENQRLSTRHDEEKASLRENRDHIVGDLRRDKEGLERTIRDHEAEINSLKLKITELESGDEVRSLQSQLRAEKKKLRIAAKQAEELRRSSEAQKSKTSEETKRVSDEKECLEHKLAEAIRSKESQHREVQELKEQNEKLSNEIGAAKNRVEKMRADIQHAQDEKVKIATQHQDAVRGKEQEIQDLQQKLEQEDGRRQAAPSYETLVKQKNQEKDQEIALLKEAAEAQHNRIVKEKDEQIRSLEQELKTAKLNKAGQDQHDKVVKGKDEQISRLEREAQTAKDRGEQISRLEQEVRTAKEETTNIRKIKDQAKAAAEKAAKDAADAMKTLQDQLDNERQASRDAKDKATEAETKRNEMTALKSEASKVEERQSHNLLVQANDANNLLFELGNTGIVQGSPEQYTLCELNNVRLELHNFHKELRKPASAALKAHLLGIISPLNVNEERIQQFSTNVPRLVELVNKTNSKLRRLRNILDTNADVQKDAMLEALHTDVPIDRSIRKPRAMKRPGKPDSGMLPQSTSTGAQAGNVFGQSQQTHGLPAQLHVPHLPTTQQNSQLRSQAALPKRDQRQSFMSLMASVSPAPAIQAQRAPRQELAAGGQPLVSGALGNNPRPVSPRRPIRIPQMPVGWTDEMTETVRFYHRDPIDTIDQNVRMAHEFDPQDGEGYFEWLKKLQSDFRIPGERRNRALF